MEIKKSNARIMIEESTNEQLIELLERTAMHYGRAKGEASQYYHMKLNLIENELKKRLKNT